MAGNGQGGPAATLTSGLLARRGDARPAMRRQHVAQLHVQLPPQEDLGWNDMGTHAGHAGLTAARPTPSPLDTQLAEIVERIHQPEIPAAGAPVRAETAPEVPVPVAIVTAQPVASEPEPEPEVVVADTTASHAAAGDPAHRKAAFTLRLDRERHLRLRLLSAMSHRSAQQLLVEALDKFIAGDSRLNDLAARIEGEDDSTLRI